MQSSAASRHFLPLCFKYCPQHPELEHPQSVFFPQCDRGSALRECIQKFPDWPPGARTPNDTALCHWVQLYRYFMSRSSEFCRHNPLCCFSTSVYCCKHIFKYDSVRKLLDTSSCIASHFKYHYVKVANFYLDQ
jgi:hypothetical protein